MTNVDPTPLFRYLEARGIAQTWLAQQIGCSTQYLTDIKVGRKPVPAWMPEKASRVLALPAFMLFDNLPDLIPNEEEIEAAS